MGRELKRVPLTFNWPIDKTWEGYLNPHKGFRKCEECDGTGASPTYRYLEAQWYGNAPFDPVERGSKPFGPKHPAVIAFAKRNVERGGDFYGSGEHAIDREAKRLSDMWDKSWHQHLSDLDVKVLVKEGRLMDLTHTWTAGVGWRRKKPFVMPTAAQVNEWSIGGFGHDSINCWIVTRAECERRGLKTECPHCKGSGDIWDSPAAKTAHNRWRRKGPPKGKGYQIWETVSEGSPISPVFNTPTGLADWMVANDDSVTKGTGRDGWLKFILGPGWAPSLIGDGTRLMTGVEAVATLS